MHRVFVLPTWLIEPGPLSSISGSAGRYLPVPNASNGKLTPIFNGLQLSREGALAKAKGMPRPLSILALLGIKLTRPSARHLHRRFHQ